MRATRSEDDIKELWSFSIVFIPSKFQRPPTSFWRYRRAHNSTHTVLFPRKNRIPKFRGKIDAKFQTFRISGQQNVQFYGAILKFICNFHKIWQFWHWDKFSWKSSPIFCFLSIYKCKIVKIDLWYFYIIQSFLIDRFKNDLLQWHYFTSKFHI